MPTLPSSRRDFLIRSGRTAAGLSAFAGMTVPHVFGQESSIINVALVGSGGRGTGAAADALRSHYKSTKLVAMADVFEHKLKGSLSALKNEFKDQPDRIDVPEDRQFTGFSGYKKAIDSLRPGDVAIFATPLAFRWVHFKYAIEKGVNCFMEKPLTADAPTSRRMLELNMEAKKKNLKVGVGLMTRHCRARQELFKRIKDGEIGEITALRSYRMHPPVASAFSQKKKVMHPEGMPEVMFQIERFHSFLWASGGLFSDFNIHQIDECCWMKDKWPVKVRAIGGRHFKKDPQGEEYIDQNFDVYSCEYTFDDGAKLFWSSRIMPGCTQDFHSYAHGTKGSAIISKSGHTPGNCATFSGQQIKRDQRIWEFPQPEKSPYQLEWDDLIDAIRNNTEHNEVDRGVMASLVTSMGRYAAHVGTDVKLDDFMKHEHEFAPNVAELQEDDNAPVKPDADGRYPVPAPGINTKTEY